MPTPWTTAHLRPDFVPSVRLPVRSSLTPLIGKIPFWVDMFNAQVDGQQTGENQFTMSEDFWWCATMASATLVSGAAIVHPWFSFSLYQLSETGLVGTTNQQNPVNAENFTGTATAPVYLTKPLYFPKGTQLQCNLQSLQVSGNVSLFQVVLMGHMQ